MSAPDNALHAGSSRLHRAEGRMVPCVCCGGEAERCELCGESGLLGPDEVGPALEAMARFGMRPAYDPAEVIRAA